MPMLYPNQAGPFGPDGFAELNDIDFTFANNAPLGTLFALQLNPLVGCRCKPFVMAVITPSAFSCLDVYTCLSLLPGYGPGTYLTVDIFNNLIRVPFSPPVFHLQNNTIYVDAQYGNDLTGSRENVDLPFQTINAALTAAIFGDLIHVRPGTYDEFNLLLKDNVNFYFDKGAEVTHVAGGFQNIFTDNGAAVSVDIAGEGRFYGDTKVLFFGTNPGSYIRIQCDQMDTTNMGIVNSIQRAGTFVLECNSLNFQTGAGAFPGQMATSGKTNIECAGLVNISYLGMDGSDTTIVGDVVTYTTVGLSKIKVYGNSQACFGFTVTPGAEHHHFGTINQTSAAFGGFAYNTFAPKAVMMGDVTSIFNPINISGSPVTNVYGVGNVTTLNMGGASAIVARGGNIVWRGNITAYNPIIMDTAANGPFTVEIHGNLIGISGIGFPVVYVPITNSCTQFTLYGNIIGGGVDLKGPMNADIHALVNPGVGTGVSMGLTYTGICNLRNAKVYSGVGAFPVRYDGGFLELDDTTLVGDPGTSINSVFATVPMIMKIYGASMANLPYNANVTPVINVFPTGFIVDPNVS